MATEQYQHEESSTNKHNKSSAVESKLKGDTTTLMTQLLVPTNHTIAWSADERTKSTQASELLLGPLQHHLGNSSKSDFPTLFVDAHTE